MIKVILLMMLPFAYCTSGSVDYCVFDGNEYKVGEVLDENHCFQMTCTYKEGENNAVWTPDNNSRCKYCQVCNDPHFKTYDGTYYDFHGTCNYTLTQQITNLGPGYDETYNPDYGVFSKFGMCGSASCVHKTTFKNDQNTMIEFTPTGTSWGGPFPYKINDENPCSLTPAATVVCNPTLPSPTYHPVITWEYTKTYPGGYSYTCRRFQGTHFAVEYCGGCVRIYANYDNNDFNPYGLNGLCGLFNHTLADDFTKRDNTLTTSILDFAISWKTSYQPEETCVDDRTGGETRRKRSANDCPEFEDYFAKCKDTIDQGSLTNAEYEIVLRNCANDMCADRENAEKWLKFNAGVALDQMERNENMIFKPNGCVLNNGDIIQEGQITMQYKPKLYCEKCTRTRSGEFVLVRVPCLIKEIPDDLKYSL